MGDIALGGLHDRLLWFIWNLVGFILEVAFHIIFIDSYWREDFLTWMIARWFFREIVDSFVWLVWNNPNHKVGRWLWKKFNASRNKTKYVKFYDWAKNYYFKFIMPRLRGIIVLLFIVFYIISVASFICLFIHCFLWFISFFWPKDFHLDKVIIIRNWWTKRYDFILYYLARFIFLSSRLFKRYWRIFFANFYTLRKECLKAMLQTRLVQRLLRVELLQRLYAWIYFNLYIGYYKPFRWVFFPHWPFSWIYLFIRYSSVNFIKSLVPAVSC